MEIDHFLRCSQRNFSSIFGNYFRKTVDIPQRVLFLQAKGTAQQLFIVTVFYISPNKLSFPPPLLQVFSAALFILSLVSAALGFFSFIPRFIFPIAVVHFFSDFVFFFFF